jgi:hypothetical protein
MVAGINRHEKLETAEQVIRLIGPAKAFCVGGTLQIALNFSTHTHSMHMVYQ